VPSSPGQQPGSRRFRRGAENHLEHSLRDFRLSGIDLPEAEQKRYAEVQSKLSELGSRFSNQLLDATQAWTKHITDEAALAGLTDSAKAQMVAAAQAKGLDGWLITLEFPSYYAVMTYAKTAPCAKKSTPPTAPARRTKARTPVRTITAR
jgi:oligopeptidase A